MINLHKCKDLIIGSFHKPYRNKNDIQELSKTFSTLSDWPGWNTQYGHGNFKIPDAVLKTAQMP